MEILDRLIDRWETRLGTYTSEERIFELKLCLSEIKMVLSGELGKFPPTSMDGVCHFKKYKGMRWKEVIEKDPGYVEWCLNNITGFQLDEDTHKYLIEIQCQ